jgi:hypothetical protein
MNVMRPLHYDERVRPICAGVPILNPHPLANVVGTLGLIFDSPAGGTYGISCYHVLYGSAATPSDVGPAPVYQPAVVDAGNIIADLEPTAADRLLDCAACRLRPGVPFEGGVGPQLAHAPPQAPRKEMSVFKIGFETGSVPGRVFQVDGGEVLIAAVQPGSFAAMGDSGAMWYDEQTGAPVALHTGQRFAYGQRLSVSIEIQLALQAMGLV